MNAVNVIRLINVVLALASLPFSLYLLSTLIQSSFQDGVKTVGTTLKVVFAGTSIVAIFNAVLSALLLFGFNFEMLGDWGQYIFNTRNLLVNLGILLTTISLARISRRLNK